VDVSVLENSYEDLLLKFSVADTGIGISEDKFDILFKSFSQVDLSNTRKYGGTGLGLAIVKSLVDLMKGDTGFESKTGEGSLFWFTVRLKRGKEPDEIIYKKDTVQNNSIIDTKPDILVVEDNQINLKIAVKVLNELGYEADVALNGRDAVKMLENKAYDIVFMDVHMPVMDGFEATRIIRDKGSGVINHDVLIIAMTADAMKGDREECIKVGMNDYISKPILMEKVNIAIEELFFIKQTHSNTFHY
jgi:CheY-like chemotaxis protein